MSRAPKLPDWWAPLEVRLQRLDNTRNELRELMQSWNDRLVLERFSLAEAYQSGRVGIALVVDIGRAVRGDHGPTRQEQIAVGAGSRYVIVVSNHLNDEFCYGLGGNQQPMFVGSVQLIEPAELATARIYEIGDDSGDIRSMPLYLSVVFFAYQRLPVAVYRKGRRFRIYPEWPQNIGGEIVQGRAQVVNRVSNEHGDRNSGDFSESRSDEFKRCLSALSVYVSPGSVAVHCDQIMAPTLNLLDVLVGPFDL